MKKFKLISLIVAVFSFQIVKATTYYVSPSGVSTNTGTSINSPWAFQYAADRTNAGDIVYLLSGNYIINSDLKISRSGNSTNYITYAAATGNTPVIKAANPCNAWNILRILANYIVVDGIDFFGNNANITLSQGETNYNEVIAGGSNWSKYVQTNTNGICIGNDNTLVPHHVMIKNCKVHDFSGAGIASNNTDFITIENNIVYNNAWYGMYASSGISIFHSQNSSNSYSGFANTVRNNIVYNNKALVKWTAKKAYSDGNGIIIDDNKNTQISGGIPYKGSTLIENNVSYQNGGSGVYVMSSQHVTVRNNTSYWNSTETAKGSGNGELVCLDNNDITWVNNIAWVNPTYSSTDVHAIDDDGAWGTGNTNITWKNNLTYTGTAGQTGVRIAKTTTTSIDISNKLGVNPLFINPITNFKLQAGSPSINAGTSTYGASLTDLAGANRIQGNSIDMGAYEYQGITTTISTTPGNNLFTIYPNPADEFVMIENIEMDSKIELYDVLGQKIFHQIVNDHTIKIDISEFKKGIYFFKIMMEGNSVRIGKFIKE
ncbi:MAG: T9SS type A sorting domain-containing protein [Bacteroidetes bacterium]|nr:T9SS type A sorting domain-containing protein [Bacteroidota bacterium]